MRGLKPNSATVAELFNLKLIEPRNCSGCGNSVQTIPYSLLCVMGHVWYDCSVCFSTNLIVNRVTLSPDQLQRLTRLELNSRNPKPTA